MLKYITNIEIDAIEDKLCIVCLEFDGTIKLCSKCKLLYCEICAKKLSNNCSICFRNFKNNTYTQMYYYEPVEFQLNCSGYYLIGIFVSFLLTFLLYITVIIFFFLCLYLLLIFFKALYFFFI